MIYIYKKVTYRTIVLLGFLLCTVCLRAASGASGNDELLRLEAEMLKYMNTDERDAFTNAVEKLKEASKEFGNDQMFYKAWGNQCVYEAMQRYYDKAVKDAQEMVYHARENGSVYGEYAGMHTEAMILMQQNAYEEAEKAFLKAVDFHHRRFPNESAAEDLRELMKIAYLRGDRELARKFASQLLAEPNVTPHHKGRALNRLSIMAFDENNVDEFNQVYDEMMRLENSSGIRTMNLITEVNHAIINAEYKQALILADRLPADTCAERKALIYHRLGDDEKAYEYMVQYKHLSDSISRASHSGAMASIYLRMNNDRLRLEQQLLEHQNGRLRYQFYFAVGISIILVLLFIIYQRRKIIHLLKQDNSMLYSGKQGAERALKDINEQSFYESKTELPLTMSVKVNRLCNHLANLTQEHSSKGVITVFQTDLDDDYEITTDLEALEKLLTRLLDNSARFTQEGMIRLRCTEDGQNVRFTITDTYRGFDDNSEKSAEQEENTRHIGMSIAICQSIARLLRGRLWRDVNYTHGTRFCFEVPKLPPPHPFLR